jgi:hypothetical protein
MEQSLTKQTHHHPDLFHNCILPWLVSAIDAAVPIVWETTEEVIDFPQALPLLTLADWLGLRLVSPRAADVFRSVVYPHWCRWAREYMLGMPGGLYTTISRDDFARRGDCVIGVTIAHLVCGRIPTYIHILGDLPGARYADLTSGHHHVRIMYGTTVEYWHMYGLAYDWSWARARMFGYHSYVDMFDFATYRGMFDGQRLYLADPTAFTGPITLTRRDIAMYETLYSTITDRYATIDPQSRAEVYKSYGLGNLWFTSEMGNLWFTSEMDEVVVDSELLH